MEPRVRSLKHSLDRTANCQMNAKKKKNFVCSQCNKSFIDNAHLKDHEVGRGLDE